MFPFCFEWTWDTAHIVFMGGLWYALSIIGAGLAFAIVKSVMDMKAQDGQDPEHH